MRKSIHKLILTCLFVTIGLSLNAQSSGKANIRGVIKDAVTGDPLIGATISIEGTSFGAAADLDGNYILYNVPVGTYTFRFRYLGYKDIDNANVVVTAEQTIVLDMGMYPETILAEEVIVSAQARGQMAAINQQRASNQIVNIVASDRIREVPDANAAESIGRLPGVSLKRSAGEGDQVVIRGLSPKYNVMEIDGVRMEGTGGDRSVGLSGISSESLGSIELTKSLTADKDADAIGGVVNMKTRVAEEGFHVNMSADGGYNNFNQSFNNYSFNGSAGNRFFENKFGVLLSGGAERVNRNSDDLSASYSKQIRSDVEGENYIWLNEGKAIQNLRDRRRYNAGLVLDYKTDFVSIKLNNLYNMKHDQNEDREAKYRFQQNRFEFNNSRSESNESFNMHSLNTEWKFWNTTLEASYSYSRTKFENNSDLYFFDDEDSFRAKYNQLDHLKEAYVEELMRDANENIVIENSAVRWNHRDNNLRQDVSQTINLNWVIPYAIGDVIAGKLKTGYKYKKKDRSADKVSKELYFHGGIGSGRRIIVEEQIYPEFDKLDAAGIGATGLAGSNFNDEDYDYGNFLDGNYVFPYAVDLDKLTETFDGIYKYIENDPNIGLEKWQWERGLESNTDDYETKETLNAAYIMSEINIGKRIMILPGVRYEKIQTEYTSRILMLDEFNPIGIKTPGYPDTVTAYRQNGHWYPSVNVKVDITDWMDVRAAYFKSASHPDFAKLSPSMVIDDGLEDLRVQNPYIKPGMAHNVDLGVSFFTGKLGLLTVNGFYKNITGLMYNMSKYSLSSIDEMELRGAPASVIESLRAPIALYDSNLVNYELTKINSMPINNPNAAEYAGIELSWQTNMWYLPGIWSGLVLDLNYTIIWSRAKFPYINVVTVVDSSGFIPITSYESQYAVTPETRMMDQPKHLFNAKVGWDYRGFSTRLSFRYQANTTTGLDPMYSLTDSYNPSMFRIDVNVKQKITDRFSVSLDGTNLTNYIDKSYIQNYLPGGTDFVKNKQKYGMGISLGLRYEF